jgi:hypothetical protein
MYTQLLFDVFISQLSVPAPTHSDSDSLFADQRSQYNTQMKGLVQGAAWFCAKREHLQKLISLSFIFNTWARN